MITTSRPRATVVGLAATMLGLLALLSACGSSSSSSAATSAAATSGSTTAPSPVAAPAFPAVIDTAAGTVTIPSAPRAVVSMSPTATEMLYAIGAGSQVKAVDSLSDYPAEAPKTDLSAFQPSLEAIAAQQPDLVVLGFGNAEVQAGPGRHPQQVGVGQRVAEHALVGGSAERQGGSHQSPQDGPGQAQLPQDHVLLAAEGRVDMDQGQVGGQRDPDLRHRDGVGADGQAEPEGGEDQTDGDRHRPGRQPEGVGHQDHRLAGALAAASAMMRARSTTRGPQREAMSSLTTTMSPVVTAVRVFHPGRAATSGGP